MKNLEIINNAIEYIYDNSENVEFGNNKRWPDNCLSHKWFKTSNNDNNIRTWNNKPGWYWFITDATVKFFKNLVVPKNLPKKACVINEISEKNTEIFTEELIAKTCDNKLIVYNGQDNEVFSRISAHLNLKCNTTGALGLQHYRSLSKFHWEVKVFNESLISKCEDENTKNLLNSLINNERGRTFLEKCWRSKHGWPLLCKK